MKLSSTQKWLLCAWHTDSKTPVLLQIELIKFLSQPEDPTIVRHFFSLLLAEVYASMIKTFSLFILLSPHRLVFVTIMCEVRFSSRKREKSLPARNVAMKLSRQRISACQVSLLASLANKLYKYHGWLLFCIGTLSKVQWLSVVLQSSAAFVLRKTLCFLFVELTSFSFLIINGFQNSDSFCLVWDFSYTKIAKNHCSSLYFPYKKLSNEFWSAIRWYAYNLPQALE